MTIQLRTNPTDKLVVNKEIWKDIVGYAGRYQISNRGQVRSLSMLLRHNYGGLQRRDGKIIAIQRNIRNNYNYVCLCMNDQEKLLRVARLVLQSFVGPCPENMQACHCDGNRNNDDLSNLRWDTPKNNQADRVKHGTDFRGIKHPMVKLTEEEVKTIRSLYQDGVYSQRQLAKIFSVTQPMISCITLRKNWQHI